VIDAVNESTDVTACGGKGNCHEGQQCITHDLWCELSHEIHRFLSGISLQTVIDKQKAKTLESAIANPTVNSTENNTFILSEVS
jgi:Rrf2 family iron-sulfur cluster assembly transcriptional regulator